MGRRKRKKFLIAEQAQQQRQFPIEWGPGSAPSQSTTINKTTETTEKSMKLKQVKESPGLMACILEHEVTKTTASYEWLGPKIPREMWQQVLAFFKWTQDTTHSESQVRLYVNATTQQWRAWAYPQKARTGMTAREIDPEDAGVSQEIKDRRIRERAQFSDAEGWMYYGTAHHHCLASAFQSSTDRADEHDKDGLHITVGDLGKNHYSIHARLYQSKYEILGMKLSWFWDIGELMEALPDFALMILPEDAIERMAKYGMGIPAPEGTEFPQEWKDNIVFEAPAVIDRTPTYKTYGGFSKTFARSDYITRAAMNLKFDGEKAMQHLIEWMDDETEPNRPTLESVLEMMKDIREKLSINHLHLLDVMISNDVMPDFFFEVLNQAIDKMLQDELKESQRERGADKSTKNGKTPIETDGSDMDYEGHQHYPGYGHGFGIGG